MKPSEVRKAYTVADLIEVLESFEDDSRPVWVDYYDEDIGEFRMEPVNAVVATRSYVLPGVLIQHVP